jgi:hypothetical protein
LAAGRGVFNGGAWLQIDGRDLDVHYRDLDVVEYQLAEAEVGRFGIEPLMFHLAGIPSYPVVAELALHHVLRGELPRPAYPPPLRLAAPRVWWARAEQTFAYARATHARHRRLTQCIGLLAQATSQAAHAVLAARGEWVTNEKALLNRAGLENVDQLIAGATAEPGSLQAVTDQTSVICDQAVRAVTGD